MTRIASYPASAAEQRAARTASERDKASESVHMLTERARIGTRADSGIGPEADVLCNSRRYNQWC